jgi:hypothetical protein
MRRLPLVLMGLLPLACVQPQTTGSRTDPSEAGADRPDAAAPTPDAAPDTGVDSGGITTPPSRDSAPPPPDAAPPVDRPPPPPDAMLPECTASQLSCTADGTAVLTCSPQGRWVMGTSCGDQNVCSAGVCVCKRDRCDEGTIHTIDGWAEALAGGGRSLFYAVNGTRAVIRRFDLGSEQVETLRYGDSGYVRYALDAPQGNLIWCSDIRQGADRTGALIYGTTQLESGFCEQVQRADQLVYYKGDRLYRKPLDDSPRESVTDQAMSRFEVAGGHVYFIGNDDDDQGFLKRIPLANLSRVETLVEEADNLFNRLLVDSTHVYVLADEEVLRVPLTAGTQPEVIWSQVGATPWSIVQTPSHIYWSAMTLSSDLCVEAQVWRRAKSGGTAESVSAVTGHCAGEMVLLDNHIYAAVYLLSGIAAVGPTQIRSIRL